MLLIIPRLSLVCFYNILTKKTIKLLYNNNISYLIEPVIKRDRFYILKTALLMSK